MALTVDQLGLKMPPEMVIMFEMKVDYLIMSWCINLIISLVPTRAAGMHRFQGGIMLYQIDIFGSIVLDNV
jgi:hypothetical protein